MLIKIIKIFHLTFILTLITGCSGVENLYKDISNNTENYINLSKKESSAFLNSVSVQSEEAIKEISDSASEGFDSSKDFFINNKEKITIYIDNLFH